MPLETPINYVSDLNPANPTVADGINQGDDHLRGIKAAIKASFPNITGAVTATQAQLNTLSSATYPFVSASLAAGAVGTSQIADAAVTYAKLQNVAALALVGNPTGTAAAPTGITLSGGLSINAGVLTIAAKALAYTQLQDLPAASLLANTTGAVGPAGFIGLGTGLAFSGGALVFTGAFPASRVVGFLAQNDGVAPSTKVNMTADEVVLVSSAGVAVKHLGISVSVDMTVTGLNGVDVGTRAAGQLYDFYLISNGTTIGALATVAGSAPAMPTGYTFKKRVFWNRTDASSNLYRVTQKGNRAQYVTPQVIYSTSSVGAATNIQVGNIWLPLQAVTAAFIIGNPASGDSSVAPDSSYANTPFGTGLPPPVNSRAGTGYNFTTGVGEFMLTSSNVYCRSDNGATFYVTGWTDSL